MAGTVLTTSSRALLESCAKLGIDSDAILAELGVPRTVIDDPDGRLPSATMARIWQRVGQVSGDPDLALHAAESLRFGAYRVIDFLAASAPTVGVAITQISTYFPIINSAVRLPIRACGDFFEVTLACTDDPTVLTRSYVEYVLAAVVLRVRKGTSVNFPLCAVELAFPAPARTAEHERIFACPLRFDAERNVMRLGRDSWESRNSQVDLDLFGVLTDHARILQGNVPDEPGMVTDVRRAILAELRGGDPSLEHIAKQLALSVRTLQRRLGEHGLRYADLLDDMRSRAAMGYLSDRQISLSEIAYLLGFAEQSSFTRAFKRWTGKAPNRYRNIEADGKRAAAVGGAP